MKQEKKYFTQLDVFSLPANEREQYFPMNKLKGKYFFIPNFPKRSFMQQFGRAKQSADVIRLIYQGRLSEGHGFEDIIDILPQTVNGKQLQLVLKGFIDEAYLDRLRKQAVDNGVEKQLIFHGPSAYIEVPRLTATCHIGLAIHYKADIMTTTLGTSSNKTYEYAALGLPVILLDNPHFKEHLGQFSWASFTDGSGPSLIKCIEEIDNNYSQLSGSAHADFEQRLNFECNFQPAVAYCKQIVKA